MHEARRCLVIGLGQIGAGYDIDADPGGGVYTHARAIALHPSFELVGGVDPVAAQRERFQSKYGVKAHESIEGAMHGLQPDFVVIATPAELHLRHVEKVLASGAPEVIFCEKPLALSEAEGAALVQACEAAGAALFVNFIRRSEPGVVEVRRRIEAGEIATPIKSTFWYSKGLFNNGSHVINLLQYWLGGLREYLVLDKGRLWAETDPEPDVRIVFDRGSVVVQAAREEAFSFYGGELISPSGRLAYRDGGSAIGWQSLSRSTDFPGYNILAAEVENIHNDMDRYQWHVYEQLSRFLAGDSFELCSGHEALETLRVVAAIAGH